MPRPPTRQPKRRLDKRGQTAEGIGNVFPHAEIILLAVTGMSPAILTETVWALAQENPPVRVGQNRSNPDDTFRPALGLPIIQFFSSGRPQIDWCFDFDQKKGRQDPRYRGEGRFASPIILRPHRDANGN